LKDQKISAGESGIICLPLTPMKIQLIVFQLMSFTTKSTNSSRFFHFCLTEMMKKLSFNLRQTKKVHWVFSAACDQRVDQFYTV